MITYKYSALSRDGAKVSGVMDAIDEYTAVAKIKAQYPVVLKIEEVRKSEFRSFLSQDINKKVDAKALSVMCSQFAIMLQSGMNIASCMEMIGNQTEDRKLKRMLQLSAADVAQGVSVATAFEKNCEGLPVTFIETVRAGEISGTLETSFRTLEGYYAKSYQLRQKVRSAMTYPVFVLIIAVIVLLIIMVKVMPTLTAVFADLGGELPAITRFMIAMSDFFSRWWALMAGLILAAVIGITLWKRTEKGKPAWPKLMLRLPVLGNINSLNGAAQFANTMAALLQAGLSVSSALMVTSRTIDNELLAQELRRIVEKVEVGYRLGECMRQSEVFPEILTEMTAIGEETGELESTLEVIGRYYANESDYAVTQAIGKLEPAIMVVMALFTGFIVISIYLPMFTMYDLM